MNTAIRNFTRLFVLLALLLTSAVAFAQDETSTDSSTVPFVGIRYTDTGGGILVTGVITNTPAAAANLEVGDVITAIDGAEVEAASIQDILWAYDVDDTVTLSIERAGESFYQDVALMARPDDLFSSSDYQITSDLAVDGQWLFVGGVITTTFDDVGYVTCGTLIWRYIDHADISAQAATDPNDGDDDDESESAVMRYDEHYLIVQFTIMGRHEPPPRRPRFDVSHTYETDSVRLGYGDGFIEVQELDQEHELYAAGLRQFDLITSVNGASIDEAEGLFSGDVIALEVERGDGLMAFAAPASTAPLLMFGHEISSEQNRAEWLGLHEKQVTLGVRYLQLESNHPYFGASGVSDGAYVAEVIEGLPAAEAGIQIGDVIAAVDGLAVTSEIDLRNRIYAHRPGDEVMLDVLRDGELIQIDVALRVASS